MQIDASKIPARSQHGGKNALDDGAQAVMTGNLEGFLTLSGGKYLERFNDDEEFRVDLWSGALVSFCSLADIHTHAYIEGMMGGNAASFLRNAANDSEAVAALQLHCYRNLPFREKMAYVGFAERAAWLVNQYMERRGLGFNAASGAH